MLLQDKKKENLPRRNFKVEEVFFGLVYRNGKRKKQLENQKEEGHDIKYQMGFG